MCIGWWDGGSSIQWPHEAIGRAFNQAPDSLEELASKQALDLSSDAFPSSDSEIALRPGVSHTLWEKEEGVVGGDSLCPLDHRLIL